MMTADIIERRLLHMRDEEKARHLSKFFQVREGAYGEGDRMLGICNPDVRSVVKEFRHAAGIEDVRALCASPWHEVRLTGLLLLVELYHAARVADSKARRRQGKSGSGPLQESARAFVDEYFGLLPAGNNWDLVDLVAPKILGDWLTDHPEEIMMLYQLASIDDLWHKRVAVVSTWTIIRQGNFEPTLTLAAAFIFHPHDLIHKAVGWMLREVGKHGGLAELRGFLDMYAGLMPRVMLRYAIERMAPEERQHYMSR